MVVFDGVLLNWYGVYSVGNFVVPSVFDFRPIKRHTDVFILYKTYRTFLTVYYELIYKNTGKKYVKSSKQSIDFSPTFSSRGTSIFRMLFKTLSLFFKLYLWRVFPRTNEYFFSKQLFSFFLRYTVLSPVRLLQR